MPHPSFHFGQMMPHPLAFMPHTLGA